MNERIRELAKEAGLIQYDTDGKMEDVEKFAELIVRECAKVSENYACGAMPLSIALSIKKHFGVEE